MDDLTEHLIDTARAMEAARRTIGVPDNPAMLGGVRAAIFFLEEAASYFENRPTNGEDRAHWSNVYNAENCRKIAAMLADGANITQGAR